MDIKEVKLGTKLELEIYNGNGEQINPTFPSKLEMIMDDNTIMVSAPIFERNIYPVRIGWRMNVYFLQKDNLYGFSAIVKRRRLIRNIAYLQIQMTTYIYKVQRREYYRFQCSLPVEYRVVESLFDDENNEKIPMKSTFTSDISGGGICIKVQEEIELNSLIECKFKLGERREVHCYGKVVRTSRREFDEIYKFEIGVLLKHINNRDREAIIKYIFHEQRKLRRKGLI